MTSTGSLVGGARRRSLILGDVLLLVWIAGWVVVGLLVGRQVGALRSFGDTLDTAAVALHQTADALDSVADLPVVGDRVGEVAESIAGTATQVQANAEDTRQTVDGLALLLPLCLIVIPVVPVAAWYVPLRLRRRRDRRVLRAALRRDGPRPVEQYLAVRALANLPYDELRRVGGADPWRDVAEGRFDALAAAELERMGLRRDAGRR